MCKLEFSYINDNIITIGVRITLIIIWIMNTNYNFYENTDNNIQGWLFISGITLKSSSDIIFWLKSILGTPSILAEIFDKISWVKNPVSNTASRKSIFFSKTCSWTFFKSLSEIKSDSIIKFLKTCFLLIFYQIRNLKLQLL